MNSAISEHVLGVLSFYRRGTGIGESRDLAQQRSGQAQAVSIATRQRRHQVLPVCFRLRRDTDSAVSIVSRPVTLTGNVGLRGTAAQTAHPPHGSPGVYPSVNCDTMSCCERAAA